MALVVGLYDSLQCAQRAVADLIESGFPGGAVSILLRDTATQPGDVPRFGEPLARADPRGPEIVSASGRRLALIAAGPLASSLRRALEATYCDDGSSGVPDVLCAAGLPRFAAVYFNEAICDGGVLVAVQCEQRLVREARDILDTHAPDGFDEWTRPFGEGAVSPELPPVRVNGKNRH